MKIKTSEVTGAALDWAVAKCEYDNRRYNYGSPCFSPETKRVYETQGLQEIGVSFSPSTDWKQGGPIIERERLSVSEIPPSLGSGWNASKPASTPVGYKTWASGPTPLIAAMRCYVASKMGDTIEVPSELIGD